MRLEPSASSTVARRTAGRAGRSGLLWGYVFGIVVASSAISYTQIYKTPAERRRLAASFGSNHATSALFGPAPRLDTVAGFTVFKVSMTLIVVGAVWGLLTGTRLLRGEEDAGRWELLLSGQVTRQGAVAQALTGLGVGVAVLWVITAVMTVAVGRSSKVRIPAGPGLFLALALVSSALLFVAVGALTSQLAATRRRAAGYAAVFLGVSYAARMIGDSGVGVHWLVWVSPLGWIEQLQPLTSPRPLVILPIAGLTAVAAIVAVRLGGARDLGTGTLPERARADSRTALLFGPTGLAIRLTRPLVVWWAVAVAASSLLMGIVARAAGGTISGSSVQQVFSRLGAPGTGADAFLGVAFVLVAVLVSFEAAGHVVAVRTEEAEGRLDHVLVRPVSRRRWLAGRLLVAVAALLSSGILAGAASWVGAAAEHSGVSFAAAIRAGVNVVGPAILVVGIGALCIGFAPRLAPAVVYTVIVWSLLIEFVGGFVARSRWVLDTSIFHHMAAAPAVSPRWDANGVMWGSGIVAMLIGAVAFTHRDLQGE